MNNNNFVFRKYSGSNLQISTANWRLVLLNKFELTTETSQLERLLECSSNYLQSNNRTKPVIHAIVTSL